LGLMLLLLTMPLAIEYSDFSFEELATKLTSLMRRNTRRKNGSKQIR